jgi:hypothetical protein
MMNKLSFLAVGLVAIVGGVRAFAGPLNKAWVAPDATWVVHVDVEAARASTLGTFVSEHAAALDLRELDKVRDETGVDPRRDIKGITVYGATQDPADCVAIISATSAVDGLLDKLSAGKHALSRVEEDGRTLYTWQEHGETHYGYLKQGEGDVRTVIASPSKPRLLAAIGQLETGTQPRIEGVLKPTPHQGSILFVSGSLTGLHDSQSSMMLQKAEGVLLDVGEAEGKVYADLAVRTASSEDATNMLQMAQGAMAVARLCGPQDPEMKPLMSALSWIKLSTDGKTVSARLSCTSAQVRDLLAGALDQQEHPLKVDVSVDSPPTEAKKPKEPAAQAK